MDDIRLVKNGQVNLSKTKRLIKKPKLIPVVDLNNPVNYINIKYNNKIYKCAVTGANIDCCSHNYTDHYYETSITISLNIVEAK